MRTLLRRITSNKSAWWLYATRDYEARNKALLLLGFTCPLQLSAKDLAALAPVEDLALPAKGWKSSFIRSKTRSGSGNT